MSRLSSIFWLLLVVVAGFTTFKVKYAVQDVEDQLARARKQTIAEQQEIRVLTAEWTYLNQPERLADLNRRFLGLAPITAKQLQHRIEDIPLLPPTPAPEPEVAMAVTPVPERTAAGEAARLPTPGASAAARIPRAAVVPSAVVNATPGPIAAVAAAANLLSVAPAAHAATPAVQPVAAVALRPVATIAAGSLDALVAHIAEPR